LNDVAKADIETKRRRGPVDRGLQVAAAALLGDKSARLAKPNSGW
jgi:hypothetical protein